MYAFCIYVVGQCNVMLLRNTLQLPKNDYLAKSLLEHMHHVHLKLVGKGNVPDITVT